MKKCLIILIIVLPLLYLTLLVVPKSGLIPYNKNLIIVAFKRNEEAFKIVGDYMIRNNSRISINRVNPFDDSYTTPKDTLFYFVTGHFATNDREYVFSTGDRQVDAAINKILKALPVDHIHFVDSSTTSILFPLSAPLSPRGQGILYTTTEKPPVLSAGIITTIEIGNGWYYYQEGKAGDYPG